MPEIFRFFGFSFFFFSNDHEPIHIHVKKGKCEARFVYVADKDEFVLESNRGVKANELSHIQSIIDENKQVICTTWKQFFYGQD